LCYHYDRLVLAQRINKLDRAFTPDGQRQNGMWKKDGISHGQNREGSRLQTIIPQFRVSSVYIARFVRHVTP
jgi:hypothetical protein